MIRNYLTIAFRRLGRGGTHTAVNVAGLALGTAACLLLFLLVHHEWSFDAIHEHGDEIRRVYFRYEGPEGQVGYQAMMPPDFTPDFKTNFPAIAEATRLVQNERDYRHGDRTLRFLLAEVDPDFYRMFSFPVVAGDAAATIADVSGIVIDTDVARTAFGVSGPDYSSVLGQSIVIPLDTTEISFTVGAVMAPMPDNSSISFQAGISFENYGRLRLGGNNWGGRTSTYVRIPGDGTAAGAKRLAEALETSAQSYVRTYGASYIEALRTAGALGASDDLFTLHLQPLAEVHRDTRVFVPYEADQQDPRYVLILLGIGLTIMLIACINFMTLSVGQSAGRAREVGVRKALGAARSQIMRQHWGESIVLGAVALLLGVAMALMALPAFRTMAGSDLPLAAIPVPAAVAAIVLLLVFVGLVAGGYPAVILSRFVPARVLKGQVDAPRRGLLTRVLVVMQFTISIGLIAATLVMTQQLRFMLDKDLGFDDDFLVAVDARQIPGPEKPLVLERLKHELMANDHIVAVERAGYTFTRGSDRNSWQDANGNNRSAYNFGVGYDYLTAMGMELAEGRFFDEDHPSDPTRSIVVNEALVREFGIENPVGTVLTNWLSFIYEESPTIIGVVKDFNFRSLHNEVQPLVMNMHPDYYNWMGAIMVKIRPGDVPATLASIERAWNASMPGRPFTYSFVNEDLASQYAADQRWQGILTSASMLAILIACMGLFGLALLAVTRRTKEIGIRKVLGASAPNLSLLVTREFVTLVLIAAVIAIPPVVLATSSWLEGFAYHVSLSPWVFILATVSALVIAVTTVAFHSVRAALADPVRSLRYE